MNFDTSTLAKDYSSGGIKIEGQWETDRNKCYRSMIKDMIRECFKFSPDEDIFVGHHICFDLPDPSQGGVPIEFPSLDTLYLDHYFMRRLFGDDCLNVITKIACEPVETRDQLAADLYYGRNKG